MTARTLAKRPMYECPENFRDSLSDADYAHGYFMQKTTENRK